MKKRFKYFFILVLIFITVFTWREVLRIVPGQLKFYLLDVGQGDAIFIETSSGNQILIDGGPGKAILKELGEIMPFYDRSLDLVILTHPHLDHVGGLVEILKTYEVERFMDSGDVHTLAEYRELKRLINDKDIFYIRAQRGLKIVLDRRTELDILAPEKIVGGSNLHRNMVISGLSFGHNSFLLMGDAERPEEFALLEKDYDIRPEVLKVGHHGSRTSSSQLFLEKVFPDYALISVGRKNKYSHPHLEVLERLKALGVQILRTDLDSRIKIESDGQSLTVTTNN